MTTSDDMQPLAYARPGTFPVRRRQTWRPWVAATLWLFVVVCGAVAFVAPEPIRRLPVYVALVAILAVPAACLIALVGGFFLFPRRWRMTAVGLLVIVLSILLPMVMWLRE
jgi:hypothetical protein